MPIRVVTCMHGRPEVTRIFIAGLQRVGLPCTAAISPNDHLNEAMCIENGIDFVTVANEPLGAKWNAALGLASLHQEWTGAMILGSDDLVSSDWVRTAEDMLDRGEKYLWPYSCAFYEPSTARAKMLTNSGTPLSFGAGRVIHRRLLERLDWKPLRDDLGMGLDQCCHSRVKGLGAIIKWVDGPGPVSVVDIKTPDNMHPFERFGGANITADTALAFVSERERKMIDDL